MSLATQFDLTREEIVAQYRQRIQLGKRNKLGSSELGQLILHFIDNLKKLDTETDIKAFCDAEISLLEEGYPQSTLGSDYLPKYRKAIQTAIVNGTLTITETNSHRYIHTQRITGIEKVRQEHWALTYLKYDPQTYEALDKRTAIANRNKQLNLRSVNPHRYLEQLVTLLHSNHKFAARHQAIAVAGLTGRRIGEVLAKGRFSLSSHPYLLRFEGHQKTAMPPYDIVTLIPAAELLEHIEHFRKLPEIHPLLEMAGEELTLALNKLDVQVNRECSKYLGDIVPSLEERDGVSVHNQRSLWGAIAARNFCPDNQHEYPFLQHYLGHALQSSATGHYFRYQLVDEAGQPLRDKGVLLAEVGELPLFDPETTMSNSQLEHKHHIDQTSAADDTNSSAKAPQQKRRKTRPLVEPDDLSRLHSLMAQQGVEGTHAQVLSALLDWAEQQHELIQQPVATEPASTSEHVAAEAEATDTDLAISSSIPALDASAIAQRSPQSGTASIDTNQSPALTELTNRIESLEIGLSHLFQQQDRDRTLTWFTTRLEFLEAEVSRLQQERNHLQSQTQQVAHTELQQLRQDNAQLATELKQLHQDNSQLATDLAQALAKLEGFRKLLNDNEQSTSTEHPGTGVLKPKQQQAISLPSPQPQMPTSSTPTVLQPQSTPVLKSPGRARQRAESIFQSVQAWNCQHPDNTFAINPGLLEHTFGINRKAAKDFCQDMQSTIEEYHHEIEVTNDKTHNRGKDTSALIAFVDNSFCSLEES